MKKMLLVILLLISTIGLSQYPIIEEFNAGTTWTYTNGAGMQNYGPPENYATFNIGNTPYPDNANVTITSPVYNLSTCLSGLKISFPLSGIIDNGFDFMYFEYKIGAGAWVTVATFTGLQNATFTYNAIPNTATQFRFILVTDASFIAWYKPSLNNPQLFPDAQHTVPVDLSNSYVGGSPKSINVYYYDITRFTINCTGVLPIELLEFTGEPYNDYNVLKWITASETNNDYFTIERSFNAVNFEEVGKTNGAGTSTTTLSYSLTDIKPFEGVTYYRLTQTDYNGQKQTFNIISVSRMNTGKNLIVNKITNLLGQDVPEDYDGVKIYYFSDGSVIKKYIIK